MAGRDLFDDELTHRTEHSIEFQVVFLQYLLGGRRDFTIVPILVGSFHDLMERGIDPIAGPGRPAVHRGPADGGGGPAARRWRTSGGSTSATSGPEFGDPSPVDPVAPGAGAPVRRRDARPGRGRRPGGLVPHGRRDRQSLAGLRPGGDVYFPSRHRPGTGPAAEVRAGPGRSPDLLRQLRQHGVPRVRSPRPRCHPSMPMSRSQPPHADEPRPRPGPSRAGSGRRRRRAVATPLPRPRRFPRRGRCATTRRPRSGAGMARATG